MATATFQVSVLPVLDAAAWNRIVTLIQKSLGRFGGSIKPIDEAAIRALQKAEGETLDLEKAMRSLREAAGGAQQSFQRIGGAVGLDAALSLVDRVTGAVGEAVSAGTRFEQTLADVGKIVGATDEQLADLGGRARSLANEFGTSVNTQLLSFQGILSKLGPEVAQDADALQLLSSNVNVLAKAGGIDAQSAMTALTDTLLQMGLASGTPAEIARNSTDVINALAAGAQVGAAEAGDVAAALVKVGVGAKGANVGLAGINTAIQILAKGGIVGAEAGTNLRNVFAKLQLASGPAEEALQKMGTGSQELGAILTTSGLGPAMEKLRDGFAGLSSDSERNAARIQIFGAESEAAAGILIDNIQLFDEWEQAITAGQQGTGAAFDQARQSMDTTAGTLDRLKARVENAFISLTQFAGDGITTLLGASAQLGPSLASLASVREIVPEGAIDNAREKIKSLSKAAADTSALKSVQGKWSGFFSGISDLATKGFGKVKAGAGKIGSIIPQSATSKSLGLIQNLFGKAGPLVTKFGGLLKGLGLALIGPWGLAIAAVVAGVTLLYYKFAPVKQVVDDLINGAKALFAGLSAGISALINLDFSGVGKAFSDAFSDSFDASTAEDAKKELTESLAEGIEIKARLKTEADFDALIGQYEAASARIAELSSIKIETPEQAAELERLRAEAQKTAQEIARIAPGAIESSTAAVNEQTGQLEQVHTISVERARELGEVNKQVFGEELKQKQEEYSSRATELVGVYDKQKTRLVEIEKAAKAAAAQGDNGKAKELIVEYEELRGKIDGNRAALVQTFQDGQAAGQLTEKAADGIRRSLGLSTEQAEKLVEVQRQHEAAALASAEAVKSIGESFDEAKSAAEESVNATLAKLNTLELQRARLAKDGKRDAALDAEAAATKKLLIEQDRERDNIVAISKANSELIEEKKKKTSSTKTAFQLAQAEYKLERSRIKAETERDELAAENARIAEQRERTGSDELATQTRKIDALAEERRRLLEIFKIKTDEQGAIVEIGTKLKDDERQELENDLLVITTKISAETNKAAELIWKGRLDDEALQREIAEIQRRNLQAKVELGIAPRSDLITLVEQELVTVERSRREIEERLAQAATSEQRALIQKQLAEITSEEIAKRKEVKSLRKADYDEQVEELRAKHAKEEKEITSSAQRLRKVSAAYISQRSTRQENDLVSEEKRANEQLEELREQERISETEYKRERLELEEEFAARRSVIKAEAEGSSVRADQEKEVAELQLRKTQLEELLAVTPPENNKAIDKLKADLAEIEQVIKDKAGVIAGIAPLVADGMAEVTTALFSLDGEGAKEGMRKTFANLAGFLKQLLTATALQIVLESGPIKSLAAAAGPFAPAVIATATAAVTAGINALASPIISGLTSFGSGAIVTEPTVALVGDRNPARNDDQTEFILGSRQLQAVTEAALSKFIGPLNRGFDRVVAAIRQNRPVVAIGDRQIYDAYNRAEYLENQFAR